MKSKLLDQAFEVVRYLKYIVLIFGTIGLALVGFFYTQNRHDIHQALDYRDRLDFENLKEQCQEKSPQSVYPCLKVQFESYLKLVSLTGTSIGMKFVFNIMDKDKDRFGQGRDKVYVDRLYSMRYLELNNLALSYFYRQYFGFSFLYGGFISSLKQYTRKAYRFNQDIIMGLEGREGLILLKDHPEYGQLNEMFVKAKKDFYRTKKTIEAFIEKEWKKLSSHDQ